MSKSSFFASLEGRDSDVPGPIENYFTLNKIREQKSVKYGLTFSCWECRVKGLSKISFSNTTRAIYLILEKIFEKVLEEAEPQDKVRIRLSSKHLKTPIWTPPIPKSQLTVDRVMLEVEKVLQSNESFRLDDSFELWSQIAVIPKGASGRKVPKLLYDKLNNKKCVSQVRNEDGICLARALVIGRALADGNQELYRKLLHHRYPTHLLDKTTQTLEAKKLIAEAGLPIRQYDLIDVQSFQDVLPDYMIVVIGVEQLNSVVFSGPIQLKKIMVLHHNQHFDVLTSLPAWFEQNYYCFSCHIPYNHRDSHRCSIICKSCLSQDCENDRENKIPCEECHRSFFGPNCFDEHKKRHPRGKSTCEKFFVCSQCHRFVSLAHRKEGSFHQCGEVYCTTCGTHNMPDQHVCYMQPEELTDKRLKEFSEAKFLYFDLECYQKDGRFVPNLAVVQNDEGEQKIFPENTSEMGEDITRELCEYIFQPKHKGCFVIAHNLRGFDGYWILRWLLTNGIVPKTIFQGSKIIQMDVVKYGIKFRDSLNYVPQSLSGWAKMFGLKEHKTYFPHTLNSPEHWGSVIPFPDRKFYGYEAMNKAARKVFLKFYRKERKRCRNRFDVNNTLVKYCCQDVTTLRACSQQFRELFMTISDGICPYSAALTISGLCNYFWRTRILKKNHIALVHPPTKRSNSKKAQRWLAFMAAQDDVQIEPEIRVGRYYVDGLCRTTRTIYEFYGCFYHGHAEHCNPDTVNPHLNQTMSALYDRTMEREKVLRSDGFIIKTIWECEYDELLKHDQDFRTACMEFKPRERLHPRNSLYGGRTNAMRLEYQCAKNEKIFYKDVVSEYPYVNKYKQYPIGPHQVITKNFGDISNYFGLVYARILPPRDLWLPVLPYRTDKLTFPLCRTCAEQHNMEACLHNEDDRCLIGTWCTPEVQKSIEFGYIIKEIYEIYHFPDSQERLFAEYIDTFLKHKVEASGWPHDVVTDQQKEDYVMDFFNKEAVHLNPAKILKNPGLRALVKLCLNSFWGRLGMRDNKLATVFIKKPEEFFRYMTSSDYRVHGFDFFSDDILTLTYTLEEDFVTTNSKTNVILAAFTTCHARLHLLNFLVDRGEQTLYFDTDSIIYIQKDGEKELESGSMLGQLTDELDPGDHITDFCSSAPKSYCYKTAKGKTVVKVKGFSISKQVSKTVNFSSVLDLIYAPEPQSLAVDYPFNITRDKRTLEVGAISLSKRLRLTYNKRVIMPDKSTLPFGHIGIP